MLIIGGFIISPPTLLAPLAGYTDPIFRQLCARHGAGAGVTELLSATALAMNQRKTKDMVAFYPGERPRWAQLFAGDGPTLAAGAQVAVALGAELIDLNMGCPVRKVVATGAGAAWHQRPREAAAATAAVVAAVGPAVEVTVKIRSGWDASNINAPEMAARIADAGAAAVTVHGRTRAQGYSGRADWEVIANVVTAVDGTCPVIGNGDVRGPSDARTLLDDCGCAGVMVGRAALGNPWIFGALRDGVATVVEPATRAATAIAHLQALVADRGDEAFAVRSFRSMAMCYLKGLPGAAAGRRALARATSVNEVRRCFDEIVDAHDRGILSS